MTARHNAHTGQPRAAPATDHTTSCSPLDSKESFLKRWRFSRTGSAAAVMTASARQAATTGTHAPRPHDVILRRHAPQRPWPSLEAGPASARRGTLQWSASCKKGKGDNFRCLMHKTVKRTKQGYCGPKHRENNQWKEFSESL